MAYATQQDIIENYGEDELYMAFDRDGDGTLDTNAVDKALQGASDEIDGYLRGKYALPLSTVPADLVSKCVDIALYKGSVGTAQTEEKRQRYEDAISYLTKVAKGILSLGIEKPSEGGSSGASFSANDRQFTRDKMKGIL